MFHAPLARGDQYVWKDKKEFGRLLGVIAGANATDKEQEAVRQRFERDPAFKCSNPAEYDFLRSHEGLRDSFESVCSGLVPFSVNNRFEGPKVEWLDPRRVRSIHLLFAGKSNSLPSRFGHVALRLVVCPAINSTDQQCDENVSQHLVIGYMAHVDEFSISAVKALIGSYQSYLYANHFLESYEQYAIAEFRDVFSLPLRMGPQDRESLIRYLAEIHWRFRGDYRFLTKNCATWLQGALRSLWPDYGGARELGGLYQRPDHFFDAMKRSSLAEGERLESLAQAEHDGLYFESTRPYYRGAVELIASSWAGESFDGLEGFLKIAPLRRREVMEFPEFQYRLRTDTRFREAYQMLEDYAMLRSDRLMSLAGLRYIEYQGSRKSYVEKVADAAQAEVLEKCLFSSIKSRLSPVQFLKGIPDASDLAVGKREAYDCQSADARARLREAMVYLKDDQSSEWKQLKAVSDYWEKTIENIELLKAM